MNGLNFDSLNNITTPDEWIENVLSIPETHSRKKPAIAFGFNRAITAAVCFVLVCVMSVPLYLLGKSEIDIPIAPVTQTEEFISEYSGGNALIESSDETESNYPALVDPTEKTTSESRVQSVSGTDPIQPPISTRNTLPTDKEEYPTSTERNTTPPRPTSVVSTKPTPTEETTGIYVNTIVSCSGAFPAKLLPEGGKIYCRMYDSFGALVGDRDLYSSQHRVTSMSEISDYIFVSYDPKKKGLELRNGRYSYIFYTESGAVVYEGSVLV